MSDWSWIAVVLLPVACGWVLVAAALVVALLYRLFTAETLALEPKLGARAGPTSA